MIDAARLVTHIHRDPTPEGCRTVVAHAADARLVPLVADDLAVVLADLDLR